MFPVKIPSRQYHCPLKRAAVVRPSWLQAKSQSPSWFSGPQQAFTSLIFAHTSILGSGFAPRASGSQ